MPDPGEADTAAGQRVTPAWLELALEEYRALRAEIVATMETQDGGLRFGIAALGIVSAAGFNVWDETVAATLIFLVVIPFVSVVVLTVWMGEVARMMRAGAHILKLEEVFQDRIAGLPEPIMRWETNLRDRAADTTRWDRHYEWNYVAIVLVFWAIGLASIAAGLYRALWGDDPLDNEFTIVVAAGAVTGLTVVALFLILRKLATVCQTEGWLRVLRADPRS